MVVGSSESKIACHNSLSTLKSLAAVSKQRNEPAVMFYIHNDQNVPRSEIDGRCRRVIAALSLLGSRQNRELDTADLANWVRYQRVTSIQPGLALMDIYDSAESIRKVEHAAISVASLYADPDMATIPFTPEYHCAGYPRENVADLKELHFAIETDAIPDIIKSLESRLQDLERNTQARLSQAPVVQDDEIDSDTGLVF